MNAQELFASANKMVEDGDSATLAGAISHLSKVEATNQGGNLSDARRIANAAWEVARANGYEVE